MNASSGPKHKYTAPQLLRLLKTQKSDFWIAKGRERVLTLFRLASRKIPAYRDFLKRHKINPTRIESWSDFQHVPITTKKNYLRQYPLEKLCWDGSLKNKSLVFTATSGSTGKPFYFPRDENIDWQSGVYHEMFLGNDPSNKKKTTLVIVGFGMGVWIGGLITYQAFRRLGLTHYPVTIITPGTNKEEIFNALRHLAPKFDQVILCGYPPFIKDIIDEGQERRLNWKSFHLRIVFAAETFLEDFRDFIVKRVGIRNPYIDTINIYGSADLGTMATETPLTILLRKIATKNKVIFRSIFEEIRLLPTLAQFNPLFVNFEAVSKEILCTGNNVLPLIRYAIGDHGDVIDFNEMDSIFKANNVRIRREARHHGLAQTVAELPFVYIFERSDFSTKLYGAIIYPEHVRGALLDPTLAESLTGKFTLITKYDQKHNEYLEVNLELKPRKRANDTLKKRALDIIIHQLIDKNAEYKNNYLSMGERVKPRLVFWPSEHPLFFKPGIKQKWVKRENGF